MCDIAGAHPSRGTENACEWVATSFCQWRPGRTATPLSAPSRRTPGRRSAGRPQSQYRGPKEIRRSGRQREIKPCETFYKKVKKGSFVRGVTMNHLLGLVSRGKWNLRKIKRTKGKRESDKAHIVKKNRSSTWLCCVRHLIDTDHHTVQSCLVRELRVPKMSAWHSENSTVWTMSTVEPSDFSFDSFVSRHYKRLGQVHCYWNHKCVDEVYCGNQSVAMCGNRIPLYVFICAPYLAERLRLSHQNQ